MKQSRVLTSVLSGEAHFEGTPRNPFLTLLVPEGTIGKEEAGMLLWKLVHTYVRESYEALVSGGGYNPVSSNGVSATGPQLKFAEFLAMVVITPVVEAERWMMDCQVEEMMENGHIVL